LLALANRFRALLPKIEFKSAGHGKGLREEVFLSYVLLRIFERFNSLVVYG
jgi:hypothetical protein